MTGSSDFLAAQASGETWQDAVGAILPVLKDAGPEHRLGMVYMTPPYAPHAAEIEILLRQATGVRHWIGAVGLGTVGPALADAGDDGAYGESYGVPGLSVMLCPFPEDSFRIFSGVVGDTDRITETHADWMSGGVPPVVLAHGDSGNELLLSLMEDIVQETDGFLIGGLSAAEGPGSQIADGPDGKGVSGALLSMEKIPLQTALSQGCSPIGPVRTVTAGADNVLLEIDGKPALDVFKEDIGEVLARDLRRCAGYIFAALPVEGSDQSDYTVRNLVAIDPDHKALAIGAHIGPGSKILFCRRDPDTAVMDMKRMLENLKSRIGGRPIRGGLYVSCAARGPNQFSDPARETQLIEDVLGSFPLTGFFAQGEFCRDRLYAYTGVLTVFL